MKKLALFVEGLTEQIFAQRLIEEIAGRHNVALTLLKASGGNTTPRRFTQLQAISPVGAKYYILLCDCSGDGGVLSDINDQFPTLSRSGYHKILGLRDVFPRPSADAPRLKAAMARYLPKGPLPVDILLAIAEIEAWFIAEETHYARIHPNLTPPIIAGVLGGFPEQLNVESVTHPAASLDRIYQVAGKRYCKDRKIRWRIERTVEVLDWENIYIKVRKRVAALNQLCSEIDQFLT